MPGTMNSANKAQALIYLWTLVCCYKLLATWEFLQLSQDHYNGRNPNFRLWQHAAPPPLVISKWWLAPRARSPADLASRHCLLQPVHSALNCFVSFPAFSWSLQCCNSRNRYREYSGTYNVLRWNPKCSWDQLKLPVTLGDLIRKFSKYER